MTRNFTGVNSWLAVNKHSSTKVNTTALIYTNWGSFLVLLKRSWTCHSLLANPSCFLNSTQLFLLIFGNSNISWALKRQYLPLWLNEITCSVLGVSLYINLVSNSPPRHHGAAFSCKTKLFFSSSIQQLALCFHDFFALHKFYWVSLIWPSLEKTEPRK